MLALVSPPGCRRYLNSIFQQLFELASCCEITVQVNSINILRRLFEDSSLARDVSPYISQGFAICIKKLNHSDWAVRNGSLMMFSALVSRIFGCKKYHNERHAINKVTGKEFFRRFPLMYQELQAELEASLQSDDINTLFPILTLLSRLAPSGLETEGSEFNLNFFVPKVMLCSRSKMWKIREMSAEAMASLIREDAADGHVQTLIKLVGKTLKDVQRDENELHGLLLQIHIFASLYSSQLPSMEPFQIQGIVHAICERGSSNYNLALAFKISELVVPNFSITFRDFVGREWCGYGNELVKKSLLMPFLRGASSSEILNHLQRKDHDCSQAILDVLASEHFPTERVPSIADLSRNQSICKTIQLFPILAQHDMPCPASIFTGINIDEISAENKSPYIIALSRQFGNPELRNLFIKIFREWSHPNSLLDVRKACLKSLQSIVQDLVAKNISLDKDLVSVFVVSILHLVQDDDEDLRQAAAGIVSGYMLGENRSPQSAFEDCLSVLPLKCIDASAACIDTLMDELQCYFEKTFACKHSSKQVYFQEEEPNMFKDKLFEGVLVIKTMQAINIHRDSKLHESNVRIFFLKFQSICTRVFPFYVGHRGIDELTSGFKEKSGHL
jgi:hypothetical protein